MPTLTGMVIAPATMAGTAALLLASPMLATVAAATPLVLVAAVRRPDWVPPTLLAGAIFVTRPTALGQSYGTSVLALLLAAGSAIAVRSQRRDTLDPASVVLPCALWAWLLALAAFGTSDRPGDLFKGAVTVVGCLTAGFFALKTVESGRKLLRVVLLVLLILATSAIVTTLLLIASRGTGGLTVTRIQLYPGTFGTVRFPLSATVSDSFQVFGRSVPRQCGFFREPGLFAMFLGFAYFAAPLAGFGRTARIVLLCAVVTTASTTAIAAIGLASLFGIVRRSAERRRTILAYATVLLLPLMVITAQRFPSFGLDAKQQSNSLSLSDRREATFVGLERLVDSPLGDGGSGEANDSINLLAASGAIGLPGLALAVASLLAPLRRGSASRDVCAFQAVTVVLVTALFAQPILDSPGVWIALLALSISSHQTETMASALQGHLRTRRGTVGTTDAFVGG